MSAQDVQALNDAEGELQEAYRDLDKGKKKLRTVRSLVFTTEQQEDI